MSDVEPTVVDVLGIGENSIDVVYRLPALPGPAMPGAKLPILDETVRPGGQVATTLCTCASLGRSTRYMGTFGSDAAGTHIRRALEARGVDLAASVVRDVPNRHAVILVDGRSGERVVLWRRDPGLALDPMDIDRRWVERARLLHVDDVDDAAALHAARLARDLGLPVTCDIDRVTPLTPALLDTVTVAIVAEHVPMALTGEGDPLRALQALARRHPGWFCVTRGASGALLLADGARHGVAGIPVEVVDTTGAGDVFRGAFIDGLLGGDTPAQILRVANAAAAASCRREGAMGGVPTRAEIDALLDDAP